MAEPPVGNLLNKLKSVKGNADAKAWTALCPAHDDHNRSLSIAVKDGKIVLHCFTGCETARIVASIGLTLSDLFADSGPRPQEPIVFQKPTGNALPSAIYQYRNHDGDIVAEKGRFDLPDGKKSFKWRPAGTVGWPGLSAINLSLTDLALWGSETLLSAPLDATVYFVEGEKSAQACRDQGLLAVTFAGGASTKDFGAALEMLVGRKVALWPDNDAAGREYMALVEARLKGKAANIRLVNVPLPPKGDAWEYFDLGGTIADLDAGTVRLNGPAVTFLADQGVLVTIPSAIGTITFTFTEIERSARAFDCELSIEVLAPGYTTEPYADRINTLSSSATETLRRQLDAVFGKDIGWTKLLNTAFGEARRAYLNLDRSIDMAEIEDEGGDIYFVEPLLSDRSMNILFGDGSALKSYVTADLAFCVSMGIPFLSDKEGNGGFPTRPGHVLIVDWEDNETNFKRRMKRIALGHGFNGLSPGLIRYFHAHGVPLRDLTGSLLKIIRDNGTTLVIIDSIGPACGGRPEEAETALAYVRAVAKLGCTTLHLAHITKSDIQRGNTNYPFGSVFWNNEARRTWFQQRVQEDDSDDLDVGLFCRKVNDGPRPHPFGIKVHFDGRSGPVTLMLGPLADVAEFDGQRNPKDAVASAMTGGRKATIKELSEELHLTARQVESVLRNKKLYTTVGKGPSTGGKAPWLYGRLEQVHTGTA